MTWLIILGVTAVCFVAVNGAAKHFAKREEREGKWTADGPVNPTKPPPEWMPSILGGKGFAKMQRERDREDFTEAERAKRAAREALSAQPAPTGNGITLRVKRTDRRVGTIPRADFALLQDELESESSTDADYFIDAQTIDALRRAGASNSLLAVLRDAVGIGEGEEITWSDT